VKPKPTNRQRQSDSARPARLENYYFSTAILASLKPIKPGGTEATKEGAFLTALFAGSLHHLYRALWMHHRGT
jgi:hypothetical protein